MFAQDSAQDAYMDKFFAENSNPSLSWIHDLGKGRYETATVALLSEAEHVNNLETKHVRIPALSIVEMWFEPTLLQLMLSIGKLSHLAQLHEAETTVDESVLDGRPV